MATHQARKRFGQHFLVDPHYIDRIVAAIAPKPGDNLIEIGPGLAALTGLLIERAGHLTAIEIDRDLAARLANYFPPERLTLHVADALTFDFSTLGPKMRVVGNRCQVLRRLLRIAQVKIGPLAACDEAGKSRHRHGRRHPCIKRGKKNSLPTTTGKSSYGHSGSIGIGVLQKDVERFLQR